MPFGLVSAWNKRRRSKSEDHGDPCEFLILLVFVSCCILVDSFVLTGYEHLMGTISLEGGAT